MGHKNKHQSSNQSIAFPLYFNADQLGCSHDAVFVGSLISDLALQLVAHGSTHVSATAGTWLDLCMVDDSVTITSWGKSATPLGAGHHLVSVEIEVLGVSPKPKIITPRRLGKLAKAEAQNAFSHVNWLSLLSENPSVDAAQAN